MIGLYEFDEKSKQFFLYGVFICYILLLIKVLLVSRISYSGPRSINLIPFYSIKEYIYSNSATIKRFAFGNVIGNIVIFTPLGAYLSLFKNDKRVITNFLFIFIVSLFVEIIQGLLGIGSSDIDDIILNCLGGLFGILGYKLLLFILRDKKKVHTAITILSAIGLPFILYYLFMMRMRF